MYRNRADRAPSGDVDDQGRCGDLVSSGERKPATTAVDAVARADNPRTASRRAKTRQKLLTAARVVFEHAGYHTARLSDIVAEAGVATGTFYNYYPTKQAIFRELVGIVIADLSDDSGADLFPDDPVAGIYEANRAYVDGYLRNARMMTVILQIGPLPEVRDLGRDVHRDFETRVSRAIRHWQRQGLVYADLDPRYTANALSYMVDRFLYEWTVLELDYDKDKAVEALSKIWVRALGLERPPLNVTATPRRNRKKGAPDD
jgi:AcrR family transcriptional regulator